jgi:hypothetical protein
VSDSQVDPGHTASFVLRLRLDEEPLSGSIEAEGAGRAISFRGWIGFMSALNGLRSELADRNCRESRLPKIP